MARVHIDQMEKVDKHHYNKHADVFRTTYSVYEIDGERFLQIDTYGRNERKHKEKVSQSIQFSEKDLADLIKIIIKEFPDFIIKT